MGQVWPNPPQQAQPRFLLLNPDGGTQAPHEGARLQLQEGELLVGARQARRVLHFHLRLAPPLRIRPHRLRALDPRSECLCNGLEALVCMQCPAAREKHNDALQQLEQLLCTMPSCWAKAIPYRHYP